MNKYLLNQLPKIKEQNTHCEDNITELWAKLQGLTAQFDNYYGTNGANAWAKGIVGAQTPTVSELMLGRKVDDVIHSLVPKYYTNDNRKLHGQPVQALQRELYEKRKRQVDEFTKVSMANDGVNRVVERNFERAKDVYLDKQR